MGKQRNKKVWMAGIGFIIIALLLAACGSNNNGNGNEPANTSGAGQNQASGEGNGESGTAEPEQSEANGEQAAGSDTERVLTDPLGHEVAVPANPQRVLASYLEDHLVALGVKPVAQWSVADSPMGYLQAELQGLPLVPYDLPYEAVLGHDPDLIIIGDESLLANDKYASYAQIAPTYALGTAINSDWRQALQEVGKVLGKEAEAAQALEQYNDKLAAARAELEQAYDAPPSAIALWLVSKSFYVVSEGQSSGTVLYSELGLQVPPVVKEISSGEGGIWRPISMEALAELDADHIFLVNSDRESGSEALQDPIWQSIKAVKDGNVHEYGPETSWLYTGAIANTQIVDDVLESLVTE